MKCVTCKHGETRRGTATPASAATPPSRRAARSVFLHPPQLAQNPRPLHENGTSHSSARAFLIENLSRCLGHLLIFSDASLRDMARPRPSTLDEFRDVKGVGDRKLDTFGDRFVTAARQAVGAGFNEERHGFAGA